MSQSQMKYLVSAAALLAPLYLAIAVLKLAPRKAGYRHFAHSISELGELDAPDQRLVAYAVFLPIGLLMLLVSVAAAHPAISALAACLAVGYLGAVLFPCDAGAPAVGSASNVMHNLCGAVQYLGGGVALLTLAESAGQRFEVAGMLTLLSAVLIGYLPSDWGRGACQRVVELVLFGSLLLATIKVI